MDIFIQQVINGLTLGCVYAIVALGYTMVYGIIQLINFAHGEVVMIGALVAFSVISALAKSGLPPVVIVLAGVACAVPVCVLLGLLLDRFAYKPLRNAPRLAPLITAIGMSIILQHLAMLIWSRNPLAFPQIMPPINFDIGGATITAVQIGSFDFQLISLLPLLPLAGRQCGEPLKGGPVRLLVHHGSLVHENDALGRCDRPSLRIPISRGP